MVNYLSKRSLSVSARLYKLLLIIYPAEFRRRYGREMAQVFRDRCRQQMQQGGKLGIARLWTRMFIDLLGTASVEHLEGIRKGETVMKALQKLSLAILIYACVILTLGRFLSKWKTHIP